MADYEFLSVNRFLFTEMDARAIKSAIELGLIDLLSSNGPSALQAFSAERGINPV
jgi:hypothetical protein